MQSVARVQTRGVSAGMLPVVLLLAGGCNRTHNADIVATVNGHTIMRSDVDRMYQAQLSDNPDAVVKFTPDLVQKYKSGELPSTN